MSVYAKKNARGDPTGQWVVEVTRGGKRYREAFSSITDAKDRERAILLGVTSSKPLAASPEAPRGYTLRDLRRDAAIVWADTKDEKQSMRRFSTSMELLGLETPIEAVGKPQLLALIAALRARGLGDTTIHRYLCTVSAALRWAAEECTPPRLAHKPSFPWKTLERAEPRSDVLSAEDDARLMHWFRTSAGSPDMVIVMDLLLSLGLRIGELSLLTPADFDPITNTVTVGNWFKRTKNGTSRTLPIQPALMAQALALATFGWPSYRRVNTALHRARRALSIDGRITPHVMRHTVATRLNSAGVPTPTIMLLMGHKSEATTKGYIHPDMRDMVIATQALTR